MLRIIEIKSFLVESIFIHSLNLKVFLLWTLWICISRSWRSIQLYQKSWFPNIRIPFLFMFNDLNLSPELLLLLFFITIIIIIIIIIMLVLGSAGAGPVSGRVWSHLLQWCQLCHWPGWCHQHKCSIIKHRLSPLSTDCDHRTIIHCNCCVDNWWSVISVNTVSDDAQPWSQQVTTNKNISDTRQLTLALQDAFSVAHRK